MKRIIFHFTGAVLFTALCLWGCSSKSGEESDTGAIRKMTDHVAHDLAGITVFVVIPNQNLN